MIQFYRGKSFLEMDDYLYMDKKFFLFWIKIFLTVLETHIRWCFDSIAIYFSIILEKPGTE